MAQKKIHPVPTRVRELFYEFTTKHHGAGNSSDACWAKGISEPEEFQVFDDGVAFQIMDEGGDVYGVLRQGDSLRELGTWQQQVAEFPVTLAPTPWHGYPVYPCNSSAPENRRGERMRPSKAVFIRMEVVGLITTPQRKRLMKGDHV